MAADGRGLIAMSLLWLLAIVAFHALAARRL
jgi:hypothetical protein